MNIDSIPVGSSTNLYICFPNQNVSHTVQQTSETTIYADADVRMTAYRGTVVLTQSYVIKDRTFSMLFNTGDVLKFENMDNIPGEVRITERFFLDKPQIKISFTS